MNEPYAKVPQRVLENRQLSLEARLVLAWLIGRPRGWQLSVSHLCTTLGLPNQKWRRIRSELEQLGFFVQQRIRCNNGQYTWRHTWSAIPHKPTNGETTHDKTNGSAPIDARPVDLEKTIKNKQKEGDTTQVKNHPLSSPAPNSNVKSDFRSANSGIQAFLANHKGGHS